MHFFFFSLRETRDGGLLFSIAHSWLICISICTLNIKVSKIMELQARYHIMHQNFSYRKGHEQEHVLVSSTPKDFQTVYEGEIWCLCAVTIGQKGPILNSSLVYCSSLYCEYENHKQLTVKYFGKAFGRSKNQSAEISESQQSIDPMNNFPI